MASISNADNIGNGSSVTPNYVIDYWNRFCDLATVRVSCWRWVTCRKLMTGGKAVLTNNIHGNDATKLVKRLIDRPTSVMAVPNNQEGYFKFWLI